MEVECRGIADDDQVDVIAFEIRGYTFYQLVETKDVSEGFVYHSCFGGGGFEEFTAGLGHFRAANADEFDVVSALFQGVYQACAVGVATRFGGT